MMTVFYGETCPLRSHVEVEEAAKKRDCVTFLGVLRMRRLGRSLSHLSIGTHVFRIPDAGL